MRLLEGNNSLIKKKLVILKIIKKINRTLSKKVVMERIPIPKFRDNSLNVFRNIQLIGNKNPLCFQWGLFSLSDFL